MTEVRKSHRKQLHRTKQHYFSDIEQRKSIKNKKTASKEAVFLTPEKLTLRTPKTQQTYDKSMKEERKRGYKRCYLCAGKTLKKFKSWRLVTNEYPYDRVSETHHMITPKRHAPVTELTPYEKMEYERDVKPYLQRNYDMILENTQRAQSIPQHHHLHLMTHKSKKQAPQTIHFPLETVAK